jgi:hypothetical protein
MMPLRRIGLACCVSLLGFVQEESAAPPSPARRQAEARLPEGPGLAARFPGDRGIAKHPKVLFAEDFAADELDTVLAHWSDRRSPKESPLTLVEDGPKGVERQRALEVTAIPSQNHGGHLYKQLGRGVDKMHVRFYVKFPREGHGYIHHFVHLGGYQPATRWPQGGAGTRPAGNERVTVGIEPFGRRGKTKPPGLWGFYAYWHEMKRAADGKYWGNGLRPLQEQPVPVDRWQCVEVMLRLNTPGERDGELALWLDAKLVAHFARGVRRGPWSGAGFRLHTKDGVPFEGFSWRTDNKLQLNFFWLLHYVTPAALRRNGLREFDAKNVVRFDQVVVAEEYIGPLADR